MNATRLICIIAALCTAVFGYRLAWAADITTQVTETVATSTANDGAPDDVNITSSGSIAIGSTGPDVGVLIDSDNDLSTEGSISITGQENVTGVFIQGNRQTQVELGSVIVLPDGFTREDTDEDGDPDGPLATGTSRFGVRLDDAGPMLGNIFMDDTASMSIEGNNSAGFRLDSLLDGSLINDGEITVVGDDSAVIDLRDGVTGEVRNTGAIESRGANSVGIRSADGIGGALINESTIRTSGFSSVNVTNYVDPESAEAEAFPIEDRIDAEDLRPNGSAIAVGGSLDLGFLNNGAVDNFISDEDRTDETKDTIEDYDENRGTGQISTNGSAPAVVISPDAEGSDAGDIVLGALVEDVRDTLDDDGDDDTNEILATFNYDYGFINRGTITANGRNVGFSATGVSIGGTDDGTRRAIIEGGLENTNAIRATAFEADATAVYFDAYGETDLILNSGTISATTSTNESHRADAILIDANARVDALTNTGTIAAEVNATDSGGVATAIRDRSGTLVNIANQGRIGAGINYQDAEQPELGTKVAIDLSTHTAGQDATLTQSRPTPTEDVNGDGELTLADVDEPIITGDMLFGAGNDLLDLQGGLAAGSRVDLGAGTDTLRMSDNAELSAGLSGVEILEVDNAILENLSTEPLALNSLEILGQSQVYLRTVPADIAAGTPLISVAGSATIEAGSSLYTQFTGPLQSDLNLNLIEASNLVYGSGEEQPTLFLPAIYTADVSASNTSLGADLRVASAETLGLKVNEAAAYDSFIALAGTNADVGTAATAYYQTESLVAAYELLMPDYGDSSLKYLADELSLSAGALSSRLHKIRSGDTGGWFDFSVTGFEQDPSEAGVGFSGAGTSLQVGLDLELSGRTAMGFAGGLRNGHGDPEKRLEHRTDWTGYDLSVYYARGSADWSFNLAGTAGRITQRSERRVSLGEISETYEADWGGTYFALSSKVAKTWTLGSQYFLSPELTLDYLALSQDDFTEAGAGGNDLLALSVDEGDSTRASGTFMLKLGRYDQPLVQSAQTSEDPNVRGVARQVYLGYRSDFAASPYETEASFVANPTERFRVANPYAEEDAFLFGLDLGWSPEGTTIIGLGYTGVVAGDYVSHGAYAELRIRW